VPFLSNLTTTDPSKEAISWLGERFSSVTSVDRKLARTKALRCASRLRMHDAARRSPTFAIRVRRRCPAGLQPVADAGPSPRSPDRRARRPAAVAPRAGRRRPLRRVPARIPLQAVFSHARRQEKHPWTGLG
jgi:hypothetical protein